MSKSSPLSIKNTLLHHESVLLIAVFIQPRNSDISLPVYRWVDLQEKSKAVVRLRRVTEIEVTLHSLEILL